MTNNLEKYRKLMAEESIDCLLVNSTNEFLVEYNDLSENSRYKLTGFSGSTGDVLLTNAGIYLFVDGRYHIQADNEVNNNMVSVIKLQTGQTLTEEIIKRVPQDAVLGIFAKKNSQKRVEEFQKELEVKLLCCDPLDGAVVRTDKDVVQLDKTLTGISTDEKIDLITADMSDDENIYLTNLEEVSYLLNMRDFTKPYSSKIHYKALVNKSGVELLLNEKDLQNVNGTVFVDKSSINAYEYKLLGEKAVAIADSPVKFLKAIKTDAEIQHLKSAFARTDKALYAIKDYIENNDELTEYDIAQKLEEFYLFYGAKNLSFKSIVAKDKNSALAHYSKCSKDEIVKDGSLILIDSGAYYEGGLATDITRVFVKGEPNELQKQVYTTVLKAFLTAFNSSCENGFEIDAIARKVFAENEIDGFVFNHGLGHGIGINVHEYPPSLSCGELAKTPIKDGMCFSIEPGLYSAKHFGVRLENSCFMKDGKIHSFVNMCYEKKLINYTLLSELEKLWLEEFEVR